MPLSLDSLRRDLEEVEAHLEDQVWTTLHLLEAAMGPARTLTDLLKQGMIIVVLKFSLS
jgi:hypothetical protein